jgi:DNA polymerase III alpha subunit
MKQPPRRDRRGKQKAKIVGQEEGRECGDHTTEREKRQERQKEPREADAKQVVPKLREIRQLPRQLSERASGVLIRDLQ